MNNTLEQLLLGNKNYLTKNVFDEERFNYVDNRLDFIKTMFRK